ncbi:hypothetical protein ES703_116256 [subsurface metagenome]
MSSLAKAKEVLEKLDVERGGTEADRAMGLAILAVAEQIGRIASALQEVNSSLHNLGVAVSALKSKDAFQT